MLLPYSKEGPKGRGYDSSFTFYQRDASVDTESVSGNREHCVVGRIVVFYLFADVLTIAFKNE